MCLQERGANGAQEAGNVAALWTAGRVSGSHRCQMLPRKVAGPAAGRWKAACPRHPFLCVGRGGRAEQGSPLWEWVVETGLALLPRPCLGAGGRWKDGRASVRWRREREGALLALPREPLSIWK